MELKRGLPSGTIEHWSWMPGGGRAGIASHVIWKVGCLPVFLIFRGLLIMFVACRSQAKRLQGICRRLQPIRIRASK